MRITLWLLGLSNLMCCTSDEENPSIFVLLNAEVTGISFRNDLNFNQEFNIYTYRNFYNGGGVGVGDFNNDGLMDLYFTRNQGPNKLYLNKGDWKFDDVTERAGVSGAKSWSTGVAVADINGDGWLDIYVCNSGDVKGDDKENELFINNGDLTFTESARDYGLADKGFTTHAVFFDFDLDGDLDLYILNNSYQAIGSFNLMRNERTKRDKLGGDKLMRNDDGVFKDVSEEAGIYGSIIGFGLGATVGDVNRDGWPDIYVSNDFFERDYLYINKGDGTFLECLPSQIKSISAASMGADAADINNDGQLDLFITEMLPNDYSRLKTVTTFESWDRHKYGISNDYYYQFTRNMLQLNNGDGTFSEIGRLATTEATDWSWGALMFDMDNDGWKDIFVANGIFQDLTNQDYLQYISNEEVIKSIVSGSKVNYKALVELIPSNPVPNFAFRNTGNLQFTNMASAWGLGTPNFSNGSAYVDLDNDGDLDLVVSHVNERASVYRNNADKLLSQNRYLRFVLKGMDKNLNGIGASIEVLHKGYHYLVEQMPNRGFQSSIDPRPFIGLGNIQVADSVIITWPDGRKSEFFNVPTNQTLTVKQVEAIIKKTESAQSGSTFFSKTEKRIGFKHEESEFVDFDRDKLTYHMISTMGPAVAVADANGDGLDDFYIGGAKGQSGALFFQTSDGAFIRSIQNDFDQDAVSEDTKSLFFDADNDGDLDLYVCSGSNEFSDISSFLADRLYFNDGYGNFNRSSQVLPTTRYENTSVVQAFDFDNDGDMDLFVGVRTQSFRYGLPMNGYILKNDGKGIFENATPSIAPGLLNLGMITDAAWTDINRDGLIDLVVIGEYMDVTIFIQSGGVFNNQTNHYSLGGTAGWWNVIHAVDIDNDGDIDLVVGNHGLNSRFRASEKSPIIMYVSDFDRNGTVEQVICMESNGKYFPMALRHDLAAQMPELKKKYLKYEDFKNETVEQLFGAKRLEFALKDYAKELRSGVFLNNEGSFIFKPFPIEAQFSPIYSVISEDFNNDGITDILLGGNLYEVKPEAGKYDASYGLFLIGNGNGTFKTIETRKSGFFVDGQVRSINTLKIKGQRSVLVTRNNDSPIVFQVNKAP
ncbi:MAG: VCBS repeat-containing protein [Cyclobacteriaceae bacterium]|nr:VCBS repeat-containing protein [Cyclobacteriaceae bacterium]